MWILSEDCFTFCMVITEDCHTGWQTVESFYASIDCTYVYWTVHHLGSSMKTDQLDVTCFIISLFNAQHVSDVNASTCTNTHRTRAIQGGGSVSRGNRAAYKEG